MPPGRPLARARWRTRSQLRRRLLRVTRTVLAFQSPQAVLNRIVLRSPAEAQHPEARERRRAVRALYILEHLQRLLVLPGEVIGIGELQLGVIGTPEAATELDALLHHREPLVAFSEEDEVKAVVEARL